MAIPERITVGPTTAQWGAISKGNALDFFVVTGSKQAPLACLADNNGFPQVHQLYARGAQSQGKSGIHVTVTFDAPAHGNGLAVNLYQTDMVGDFSVHPMV